jgi:RNA polymerase sigma factor (sigma-70 family)
MRVDPEALFIANQHRLFKYFRRAVGQTETARDLTQDVFLRVSRTAVPEAADGDVRAWLFRIARNLALDHYRKRVRQPDPVALTGEDSRPPSQDVDFAVTEALAALADLDRDVFLMREVAGLGYEEIGRAWEEDESRLVVADLWLVERLSNGTEAQRSQPLSVRGLPNRPFRFYFDGLVDANVTLDIYGTLMLRLESDAIAVSVETRCRWAPGSRNFSGPQRSVRSDIQVKPAETVEIRLPTLGDDAGPFAKRGFSIRIRARQLR